MRFTRLFARPPWRGLKKKTNKKQVPYSLSTKPVVRFNGIVVFFPLLTTLDVYKFTQVNEILWPNNSS